MVCCPAPAGEGVPRLGGASHGRTVGYRPRLRPMISFMISVVPP